ncbi:collagen alpha-1(I) chain-like [Odocoileus virginianus]|uniref:Collagen alpha-1(I) chain-like n=1 Tax=Odocoileus virginianus TaxID=9874 RepID=A0ABM4IDM6_ODOVR
MKTAGGGRRSRPKALRRAAALGGSAAGGCPGRAGPARRLRSGPPPASARPGQARHTPAAGRSGRPGARRRLHRRLHRRQRRFGGAGRGGRGGACCCCCLQARSTWCHPSQAASAAAGHCGIARFWRGPPAPKTNKRGRMDPFPGAKTRSPRERRCQRVTSGGGACAIYGSGRPSPRPSPPPPPPPRSPTDCLTAPRAGPSPASPASPAAAQRRRRPQPRAAAPRAHPPPRKFLLAQINARGRGPPRDGPEREAGRRRQAAGRGLEGRAPGRGGGRGLEGWGRAPRPRRGAQFSPVCKPTDGCWGADVPSAGPHGALGLSAPAEATECVGLGHPRRRRALPDARSLSPWPRETPSPGLSLGAATDKEAPGSLGGLEARPGLSGDPGPGVRLRAPRDAAGARVLPSVPLSPGERAARDFPDLVSRNRRAAGREQRVGPAAGLLQPGLGVQAHCPLKGPALHTGLLRSGLGGLCPRPPPPPTPGVRLDGVGAVAERTWGPSAQAGDGGGKGLQAHPGCPERGCSACPRPPPPRGGPAPPLFLPGGLGAPSTPAGDAEWGQADTVEVAQARHYRRSSLRAQSPPRGQTDAQGPARAGPDLRWKPRGPPRRRPPLRAPRSTRFARVALAPPPPPPPPPPRRAVTLKRQCPQPLEPRSGSGLQGAGPRPRLAADPRHHRRLGQAVQPRGARAQARSGLPAGRAVPGPPRAPSPPPAPTTHPREGAGGSKRARRELPPRVSPAPRPPRPSGAGPGEREPSRNFSQVGVPGCMAGL